jgi:exodeoxyribonuclease VII large subunit
MHLLSVADLNTYLKELLESDPIVRDLWVEGEIAEFKLHRPSGHCYFTLKDAQASLRGVMWRTAATRLAALPKPGDLVLVHGYCSIYESRGDLQIYADAIQPAGVGLLYARFAELQARLEHEGLFAVERKRPLPALPRRIGIASAPQSAALADMLQILARRCPLVEVIVAPCTVQGERAPESIVEALYLLYSQNVDLIILARGGGSLEDLWAFNDEAVARAVFASPVPLITGVGHETDTTIVDFVADVRAPTPSAAAELATPERAALAALIADSQVRMDGALAAQISLRRDQVTIAQGAISRADPRRRIVRDRQALDELARRADRALSRLHALHRAQLHGVVGQLQALNPQAVLARGYAVVRDADTQHVLTNPAHAPAGTRLLITLRDGDLPARVLPMLGADD